MKEQRQGYKEVATVQALHRAPPPSTLARIAFLGVLCIAVFAFHGMPLDWFRPWRGNPTHTLLDGMQSLGAEDEETSADG